jgi:hypothetical protein
MLTAMTEFESGQDKAVRLLNEQLTELQSIRGLNGEDPSFTAWHDTTMSLLKRFLSPTSPHLERFVDIPFLSQIYPAPPGHERGIFVAGCKTADATIRAVLKEIENFGVYIGQTTPGVAGKGRSGSLHQTFNAPVSMNQAIATDNAIQKIGQVGDKIGASLKEIADLLQQSQDLTPRQVNEGLAGIEVLASEQRKPVATRN